jgi:hypothetical protein
MLKKLTRERIKIVYLSYNIVIMKLSVTKYCNSHAQNLDLLVWMNAIYEKLKGYQPRKNIQVKRNTKILYKIGSTIK